MASILVAALGAVALIVGGALTYKSAITASKYSRIATLEERVDNLVDTRIEDWNKYQAKHTADAVTKRKMGDHIDQLEAHIWAKKSPPPPKRPDDI